MVEEQIIYKNTTYQHMFTYNDCCILYVKESTNQNILLK